MIGDWLDPARMSKDSLRILQQEGLVFGVTELMAEAMQDKGVTKAELAKRLGKSRSFVTQLLDGTANMTLKTIADVFTALGLELRMKYHQPDWARDQPKGANRPLRLASKKRPDRLSSKTKASRLRKTEQ